MSKQTDQTMALQAKRDLESLQGFLNVLEVQITVLYDSLPSGDDGNREEIQEAGKELLAIARSIHIASTMAGTAESDFEALLDKAYPTVRPIFAPGTG